LNRRRLLESWGTYAEPVRRSTSYCGISATTGQQAHGRCPDSVTEIFIEGTEPPGCESHQGGLESWVTRLVHWLSRD